MAPNPLRPIGYGDGLNMYAYARNNPMNFRDPSGLSITDDIMDEIVVIGSEVASEALEAAALEVLNEDAIAYLNEYIKDTAREIILSMRGAGNGKCSNNITGKITNIDGAITHLSKDGSLAYYPRNESMWTIPPGGPTSGWDDGTLRDHNVDGNFLISIDGSATLKCTIVSSCGGSSSWEYQTSITVNNAHLKIPFKQWSKPLGWLGRMTRLLGVGIKIAQIYNNKEIISTAIATTVGSPDAVCQATSP